MLDVEPSDFFLGMTLMCLFLLFVILIWHLLTEKKSREHWDAVEAKLRKEREELRANFVEGNRLATSDNEGKGD